MEKIKTAIIGGDAVGCAIAHELTQNKYKDVFVFEKGLVLMSK